MIFELFLALIVGILAGTITGLIPGIHINLVGVMIVTLSTSTLINILPIYLIVFIVSMSITHTFLDFIPSVLLGAPDTDTELSILPGHELLKKGKGYEAIILTAYGSILAIFILILISFPSIIFLSKFYSFIQLLIPYFLIFISITLIFLEKRKISATIVFSITGILGYIVLSFPESSLNQPLLPLLSGLFGTSNLIISIKNKTKIPKQKISTPKKIKILRPMIGSIIASPICSLFPGLGSGQAAIIGNTIMKNDKKGFLILLGATNTLVMGFSFISLYVISRTRTGSALAIKDIIGQISLKLLILILIITFITGIISFFLTKTLSKILTQKISKINYTKISIITLTIILIVNLIVSGFLGITILIISTFTGIFSINQKVRRSNMMGCLLIPVIIFYLL
jgi:putative membrane protein